MNRNILIEKLVNNINETNNGSIIASPTKNNPNYFYHWIRDSAITMKAILKEYIRISKPELLHIILKYINFEYKLQNLNSISGLGEPKYNVDGTTFNDSWGRPQNDGPALRGLIMLSIRNVLNYNMDIINLNIINIIIKKDLEYVLNNYKNESFDLWEEKKGHHFYTRVVQAKFLKEYINNFNDKSVENDYKNIKNLINNHFMEDLVISSFDNNNKILRVDDSSIFMCLNHIDYDYDIVPLCKYNLVNKNIDNLLEYFNKKSGFFN